MDEELRILEREYCPPLDPALVHAFYYDYQGDLGQLRALLDAINESAAVEQATDFDASGSSGGLVHDSPSKGSAEDADSNADTWATQTTLTDHSHISNNRSTTSLGEKSATSSEGSGEGSYWQDAEQYDPHKKELVLAETFPNLRIDLIRHTLKTSGDDLDKATDELLNHVYFEDSRSSPTEEGPVAKGIDAFSEDSHVPQRSKKGKNKRKQRLSVHSLGSHASDSDAPMSPTTNRWVDTSRDVDFLTARTKLPRKAVSSLYHASGTSLSATILSLMRKDIEAHKKDLEPDAGLLQDALGLYEDFPSVDFHHALALVRLADPSVANARDLAKKLVEQPASETGGKGGIKLDLRYAPPDLSDPASEATRLPTLAPSARPHDTASLAQGRSKAFQQASSAYRSGKSTPLMRQAAAFYAQEGRDYNANLKAQSQTQADTFVASQSGASFLDLHGVTVANATRIAKQKTQAWWDGLGERRIRDWGAARGGVGEGYRIVTGLGRHSEGGRGKIGPAVVKMLIVEGWKVEHGVGEVVVTGRMRRR